MTFGETIRLAELRNSVNELSQYVLDQQNIITPLGLNSIICAVLLQTAEEEMNLEALRFCII